MSKFARNRSKTGSTTDPADLEMAQQKLFRLVQDVSFHFERKSLLKSSPISKTSTILKLSLSIGPNGLFLAKRRTQLLEFVTFGTIHSVILDARHPSVHLFLKHLHERHCHHGVQFLRVLTHQNFSILKLRATLRSIQLTCVTCRKLKVEAFSPIMFDVPRERLAFRSPPFSNTGIDYFRPFNVSIKISTEKRWVFFFTCPTTRAVHLEVVPSMDSSSSVMGDERFVAHHGVPGVIWSDNGTNFIATEKELLNNVPNWNPQTLTDTLVKKGIK